MQFLLLILLLIPFSSASVSFDACGGDIKEIRVGTCSGDSCEFKRGMTDTFEVDFISPIDASSLTADLFAKIGGLQVPHPNFNHNPCNGNVQCPLKKGQKYTYKYTMKVEEAYPKIKVGFRLNVKGNSGDTVFCFEMTVKVV